jgi:hypothetical protein
MINRKTSPAVKEIKGINFRLPKKHKLDNGISTYIFPSQNSPVIKLDVVFNAGIERETKNYRQYLQIRY